MGSDPVLTLATIEFQLGALLPTELYRSLQAEPGPATLMRVFEHLRTLQHILQDYTPHQLCDNPPQAGQICHSWQEGTLLFTDLAGFTPLLEASAASGAEGATGLLKVLNQYFSQMIEIISKSGGDLLEFTGDAMLVQFLADQTGDDTAQAVRAGLRMQRAMANFAQIETAQGSFSLGMRIGIHAGRFLTADIGTTARMVHVLLGRTVRRAKRAEGAGRVGRVCLTQETGDRLLQDIPLEPLDADYTLVQDCFTAEQLGEYDITLTRRRSSSALLFDRSMAGLTSEILGVVRRIEPLASYFPPPLLNLLVEHTAKRRIPPHFPTPVILFINLKGLPEAVDAAQSDEVNAIVCGFCHLFSQINAVVEDQGGILQKVTYHSIGSDLLIYFGMMGSFGDEAGRAAATALAVRHRVAEFNPPIVQGKPVEVTYRMGLTVGSVFAAEIGEPRGRREFNILGDPVNTAARLMTHAAQNQILLTEAVYALIGDRHPCIPLGEVALKGKAHSLPVFALT